MKIFLKFYESCKDVCLFASLINFQFNVLNNKNTNLSPVKEPLPLTYNEGMPTTKVKKHSQTLSYILGMSNSL